MAIWTSEFALRSSSWPGIASRLETIDRFEVRSVYIAITVSFEELTLATWMLEPKSISADWPGTGLRFDIIDRFQVRSVRIEITVSVEETHRANTGAQPDVSAGSSLGIALQYVQALLSLLGNDAG